MEIFATRLAAFQYYMRQKRISRRFIYSQELSDHSSAYHSVLMENIWQRVSQLLDCPKSHQRFCTIAPFNQTCVRLNLKRLQFKTLTIFDQSISTPMFQRASIFGQQASDSFLAQRHLIKEVTGQVLVCRMPFSSLKLTLSSTKQVFGSKHLG